MAAPSIKGTAFQSAVDDIQRLVAEGRISQEALEAQLRAEDLAILDQKVNPTHWYPIASYERYVQLLLRSEAPRQQERYLIERGERAAERLAAMDLYSQLDATTQNLGNRVGRIIVTLSRALYNFTRWHYEPGDGAAFTIRVEEAADFPEVSRFTSQGFIQGVARRASGRPMRVVSQRPLPDLVLYIGASTA